MLALALGSSPPDFPPMNFRFFLSASLLCCGCSVSELSILNASNVLPAPRPIVWEPSKSNDLQFSEHGGEYQVNTTGNDPFIRFELPAVSKIKQDWILEMETFCVSGIKRMELYVGKRPSRKAVFALPAIDSSEGWTIYQVNLSRTVPTALSHDRPTPVRLDFGMKADVRLSIRNVRVRPANDQEVAKIGSEQRIRAEKEALATEIDVYYQTDFPASIDRVEFLPESIRVTGKIGPGIDPNDLYVVARRQTEISAKPVDGNTDVECFSISSKDERFEAAIPASSGAPLRYPGVRFQLIRKTGELIELASAARYPDQFGSNAVPAPESPPRKRIAKGLTCLDSRFTTSQLRELGLEHGNINITMNHLIRKEPSAGYEATMLYGRRVFYSVDRIRRLDRNVQSLRRADLTIAGILLLPNREKSPPALVHPDADPAGVYAMPNLKTREGADLYAMTCEFLAKRYSGSESDDRRIDHWIVHNEIDAGWSWTNMGEQPQSVFLEHYFRSLRIVDACVRRHNPNATAFISLTHMWNRGELKPWRWYPVKSVMESLIEHNRIEGDFPWGVAFHPYPEDLWQAATWNDSKVTDDFDTPTISIKNIEVLDRYMHTEAARRGDGSVRPVILSEQGFHAPEDNPERLGVQAAALLYTFEQLRRCKSILAFDYHRPVDHPNEGGLRLGLRGLPSQGNRIGKAKPAWEVYRDIGTEAEQALNAAYRHYWDDSAVD